MLTVKAINKYGEGRFVIHYEVVSPCLCSFNRYSMVVYRKNKPSDHMAAQLAQADYEIKTNVI